MSRSLRKILILQLFLQPCLKRYITILESLDLQSGVVSLKADLIGRARTEVTMLLWSCPGMKRLILHRQKLIGGKKRMVMTPYLEGPMGGPVLVVFTMRPASSIDF